MITKRKNRHVLLLIISLMMVWGQGSFAMTFAGIFNQANDMKGKIYFVKGYGNITIIPSLNRFLQVDPEGNVLDVIGVKVYNNKVYLNWVESGIREIHNINTNLKLIDTGLKFNFSKYLKSLGVKGDGKPDPRPMLTQSEGKIPE